VKKNLPSTTLSTIFLFDNVLRVTLLINGVEFVELWWKRSSHFTQAE